MMRTLRENTVVVLWILVIAFVATIVFSWGMGGFDQVSGGQQTDVATVNGQDLDIQEYERLITGRLQREQTEDNRPDENQIRTARRRSWDDLINLTLERQTLARLDLGVSDLEVSDKVLYFPPEYVTQDSSYQVAGAFDTTKWHDLLRSPNVRSALQNMESNYRMQIPLQKLRTRILASTVVSEASLRDDFLQKNQTALADYLLFPYSKFEVDSATIDEQELRAWYDEHREEFRVPEKRVVEYVHFKLEPSREDSLDAVDQVEYLQRQLEQGESFDELAAAYSTDASNAEQGGDLGWFGRGRMVPPFDEVAFAAEVGELAGPVETRFGLHLIKVNGHEERENDAGEREEMVRAQHILIKVEPSSMTHSDLRARADAVYQQCREGDDFHVLSAERGYELQEAQPVAMGPTVPGIGRNQRANDLIFRALEGEVLLPVFSSRDGWYVYHLKEIQSEGISGFEESRDKVFRGATGDRQKRLALEAARNFLAAHPGLAELDSSHAGEDSEFGALAEPTKINQFLRGGIGRDQAFSAALFTVEPGVLSEPVEGDRGVFLIFCTRRDDPQEILARYDEERETRFDEEFDRLRKGAYGSWTRWVKERSVIEDHRVSFGFDY